MPKDNMPWGEDDPTELYNITTDGEQRGVNLVGEAAINSIKTGEKLLETILDDKEKVRPIPVGPDGPSLDEEVAALRALRRVARRHGWVMAAPNRVLLPRFRSYISDGEDKSSKTLTFDKRGLLLGDVTLTDDDKADLLPHAEILIDLSGRYRLKNYDKMPGTMTDEVGRWNLHSPEGTHIGFVVRFEPEGENKKYVAFYRRVDKNKERWHAANEPPCDLLPFGLTGEDDRYEDVILVEGPKAMDGARRVRRTQTDLGLVLRRHSLASWHGADFGVDHTDWSALSGRKVILMADTDRSGRDNMLLAARAISRAGGRPVLHRLGAFDKDKGLDFADDEYVKRFANWQEKVEPLLSNAVTPFLPPKPDQKVSVLAPNFIDSWVWVPSAKGIFSNITDEEYDYESFSAMFPARGRSAAVLLRSDEKRLRARSISYLPGSPFGLQEDGVFNIATPSPLRSLEAADTPDLPPWFAAYLAACIPDPIAREAVLDFTAHAIAFPNRQPGWAVVMAGDHGGGKTTFAKFMGSLAGRIVEAPVEAILGEYQSPEIMHTSALFIEELFDYTGGKGRAIYQRSKPFITSPFRQMNIKNKPQFSIQNVVRLWATSNQADALLMEEGDRRWLVVEFIGRFKDFNAAQLERERFAVYRALLCRGRKFKTGMLPAEVPRTKAKEDMLDAGLTNAEVRLRAFVESLKRDECVIASDLKIEFGLNDHDLRKMKAWGMVSLGQIKFPFIKIKDGKGEERDHRPKGSIWRKVEGRAAYALSSEEVAKMVRRVGSQSSDAYGQIKASIRKAEPPSQ